MGYSQSKIDSISIRAIDSESRPKSVTTRSEPNQQSNRIVEDCIVIWLLNDPSIEIENEKAKLRNVISTVKLFTKRDECVAYITSIRVEKIFLIVLAVESFLDSIRKLPQVEKIYTLNPSIRQFENNTDLTVSLGIFSDIDSLCKQLQIDVELCGFDLIVITASAPSLQDDAISVSMKQQEASFLCTQLMREILYRLKFENNAKNDFVNFCRIHYAGNHEQLRMIDDFERNYRPQKVFSWLTRQCFLWRVLQRMQRTQEIDILYKLGFLVKHAHTQLTIFQENNSSVIDDKFIVYRGKTMFKEKLNALIRNNCGGLISFANFFTAHTDREVDVSFVRHRLAALPNATGVLFEIHVNSTVRNARSPFASLDKVYGDENIERNGILFGMYSVFRIDAVEQFTDGPATIIWAIKLTLIGDDDQQLLRLVAPLRNSEVHANPLSYMGKLFMEMGEYERAEQFFLGILQDASVRGQPCRLMRVHNGLGANYMIRGDYIKALEQYQQALDVSLSYLPPTHTDLAPLYDSIGKSYFQQGDYQKAVENYERAADLIINTGQPGNDHLVIDLHTRINSAKKMLHQKK